MYIEEWLNKLNIETCFTNTQSSTMGGGETFVKDLIATLKTLNKNWIFGNSYLKFLISKNYLSINGPRDILWLLFSKILRKKIIIYVQVPFHKKVEGNLTVYSLLVYIYIYIISKEDCYAGSVMSFLNPPPKILYPISTRRMESLKKDIKPINFNDGINFAFRFTKEKGNQSKDLILFKKIVTAARKDGIPVNHYGPFDKSLVDSYFDNKEEKEYIKFNGFVSDWQNQIKGVFVHLTNYEGFGLAPVESSLMGIPTFVNKNLPNTAWKVSPNMNLISKIDFWNT